MFVNKLFIIIITIIGYFIIDYNNNILIQASDAFANKHPRYEVISIPGCFEYSDEDYKKMRAEVNEWLKNLLISQI